jgi:hypothetical protein
MKQQVKNTFRYVYVDGDRVRVPGHRTVSYNTNVYGDRTALYTAIKTRDAILDKTRT